MKMFPWFAISIVFLFHEVSSQRCDFQMVAGRQQGVLCHNISYDLTVPSQCISGTSCGIVIDVHGLTMNGTWEEALTEASVYSNIGNCLTLQPSSGPGLPPDCTWGVGDQCSLKVLAGLDDVEAVFSTDKSRVYMGGSSEGGIFSDFMMRHVNASRFAAFVVGAAWAHIPPEKHSFLWYTGRHDTLSMILPAIVEPQLVKFQQTWNLTTHEMVSVGQEHEHHRWTDAARTVEVEWLVHNYTNNGTISGKVIAGHCAPGGVDAPPHPPFARVAGIPLRLSCPQPDPKEAEKGSWAGYVTSNFFARH